jgi:palmitoyl-protein thioesterase
MTRHGLGDTAHADGIEGFIEDIKGTHPGIYVHSVMIPEGGSADDERKAGFVSRSSMHVGVADGSLG